MTLFIFGLFILLCGIAVFVARSQNQKWALKQQANGRNATPVGYLGWIGTAIVVLAAIPLIWSFLYSVPPKEEAIKTRFGAVAGHNQSGLHFKLPIDKVHLMDAANQTDVFRDRNSKDDHCDAIVVRLAAQQTGCVGVTLQWQLRPDSSENLFKNYRTFEHVRDALVTQRLTQVLNREFASYNPLEIDENGKSTQRSLGEIAEAVEKDMVTELKDPVTKRDQIDVHLVFIPIVGYDHDTQSRLNQLQQQVALTKIARQRKQTNIEEAAANEKLSASIDKSPNVLVSRCIDVLEQMVKTGQPVPAGFGCWPGNGVAAVIAGGK